MADSTDAFIAELNSLSKEHLDRRLAKFGVKALPRAQAITFLTNVHLATLPKKSAALCSKSLETEKSSEFPLKQSSTAPESLVSSSVLTVGKPKKAGQKKDTDIPTNSVPVGRIRKPVNACTEVDHTRTICAAAPKRIDPTIQSTSNVSCSENEKKTVSSRQHYKVRLVETSSEEENERWGIPHNKAFSVD